MTQEIKEILTRIVAELSNEAYIRGSNRAHKRYVSDYNNNKITVDQLFKKVTRAARQEAKKWDDIQDLINKL